MASRESRRAVPDSEDEPMTSSPVNASDGPADKLFAASGAPLQGAEDALSVATDIYQATADTNANLPGKCPRSLDDDQHDSSIDVDISKHTQNDMRPDSTACSHQPLAEATSSTAPPLISGSASSPDVGTAQMDGRQKAEHELTPEPSAATASDTHSTPHAPEAVVLSEQASDINESELDPHGAASEHVKQQIPSDAAHDARQLVVIREERSGTGEIAHDNSRNQRDDSITHAESLSNNLNAKHVILQQDAHSYTEATIVAPSDSAPNQTGETVSRASSPSQTSSKFAISKPAEETVPSSGVTTAQASDSKGDLAGHKTDTESFDTVMDVDTSLSHSMAETQTTGKDDMTSSSHSTGLLTNASTPEEDASKIIVDTTDDTIAADSQEAQPALDSSATTTTSTSTTQPLEPVQPSAPSSLPAPAKTPQELTLATLKAQKAAMLASLAALPAIQILMEEHARSDTNISDNENDNEEPTEADIMVAANKIVKDHIKLLHEYNELKDVGQGLMGLIADQRGVRIVEVQEEFGIEAGD